MMEILKFVELVAEQFNETDRCEFTAETQFKQLKEWDSLIALSIIGMVDEEYGIAIQGEDIRNAGTINDLFIHVKAKQ